MVISAPGVFRYLNGIAGEAAGPGLELKKTGIDLISSGGPLEIYTLLLYAERSRVSWMGRHCATTAVSAAIDVSGKMNAVSPKTGAGPDGCIPNEVSGSDFTVSGAGSWAAEMLPNSKVAISQPAAASSIVPVSRSFERSRPMFRKSFHYSQYVTR